TRNRRTARTGSYRWSVPTPRGESAATGTAEGSTNCEPWHPARHSSLSTDHTFDYERSDPLSGPDCRSPDSTGELGPAPRPQGLSLDQQLPPGTIVHYQLT